MKNQIQAYIEYSDLEKKELWDKATFVFDTNVLLNLYRYSKDTSDKLMEALVSLKDRSWIPYNVAEEFMRRRCDVIYNNIQKYSNGKSTANNLFKNIKDDFARVIQNEDEARLDEISESLCKWFDSLQNRHAKIESHSEDSILNKLLKIYDNRTGDPFSEEETEKLKDEAKVRYEKKIPPGYKDNDKEDNPYGDYIIWKQVIHYAKEKKRDIILVTNDKKEDWWNKVCGKTIGPRIELRKEFFEETTGQKFHLYDMFSFLKMFSKNELKEIEKQVYDEVKATENIYNLTNLDRYRKELEKFVSNYKIDSNKGLFMEDLFFGKDLENYNLVDLLQTRDELLKFYKTISNEKENNKIKRLKREVKMKINIINDILHFKENLIE